MVNPNRPTTTSPGPTGRRRAILQRGAGLAICLWLLFGRTTPATPSLRQSDFRDQSVSRYARVAANPSGTHPTGARQSALIAGHDAERLDADDLRNRTLLDSYGRLSRPVTAAEVADWKRQLNLSGLDRQQAGWLHLWLGEWQLAANKQPEAALEQFRQAEKLALPRQRMAGRAALDSAIALAFEGAYAAAAAAFQRLLMPATALPGYDPRLAIMWHRHVAAHAGYHAGRARLGIKEPPRIDPLCGAAALAACLRSLGRPYDKKTLLAACRVTGEGSSVEDIVAAGQKLGVATYKVKADDTGLKALPKPLVAYVEHDHFVALTRADNAGVSYLCVDCGGWPGGRIDLSWKQWRAMECSLYIAAVRKGSPDDQQLSSLKTAPGMGQAPAAAASRLRFHRKQVRSSVLFRHAALIRSLLLLAAPGDPTAHPPCYVNSPKDSPFGGGGPPSGPSGQDPVNLATGEEILQPPDDLVVYNPYGPPVRWGRICNTMRLAGDGYADGDVTYQCNDFGVGWSQHYNVGVYDPTAGTVGRKFVIEESGAETLFVASSAPSAAQPRVPCAVQSGAPMLVEWDYDSSTGGTYYTITFANRTQWVTTGLIPGFTCCALAAIRDRMGNALYFNYTPPPPGFHWPLLASISTGPNGAGSTLLTIERSLDGTGNITKVSDVYGRSVYYNVQLYTNDIGGYNGPQTNQELERVSQIVPSAATRIPDRYVYGYQLLTYQYVELRILHTITVPSPTGSGSSTATINYYGMVYDAAVKSLVDANGNSRSYTSTYPSSPGSQTLLEQVTVSNAKGVVQYKYQDINDIHTEGRDVSRMNGAGATIYTNTYDDTSADPFQPVAVTDGNGNTTSYTRDQFGNVLTKTSPRGAVTTYTYDYSVFPYGELKSVQEGSKSPTTYQYYEPSGLIKQITMPLPGTTGNSSTVTYAFTYDNLGNLLTVTTPGNNAASSMMTTFDYGPDPHVEEPLTITDNLGKTIHFTYDELGRTTSYTDQVNNTTGFEYNLAGQQVMITYPSTTSPTGATGSSSRKMSYLYVGGPLDSITTYDEGGHQLRQVTYKYGKEGELLSRTGSTEPVTYTYDAMYHILTLADGAGHKTTYTYNTSGFLTSITYPQGDLLKYTAYDILGNPLTRVDGRGITTNYVYNDPENLLTNINYPLDPSHNVAFGYDAYGRRSSIVDGTGSQTIGYDDGNLVTGVQTTYTGLPTQTIAYSYYPDGSQQGMNTPAGVFAYQYYGNGTLQSLTNPFNETTTWNPTDNRLVGKVTLPNGVTCSYSYDARNRISSLINAASGGATLSSFMSMLYDAANNRATMTANDGKTTYSYDNKDQLTGEQSSRAGSYTNSFAYDAAGNPTTFRGAANTFNTDNQFTNSGYVYDGNGNPTTYQGAAVSFDEENRLTGAGLLTADYRGDGLRGWKQGATGKIYFLYNGTFPVCELDASGNLLAVNTAYDGRVISRRTTTSNTFYTFDPQGNVAQKLDASGNILSSSVYDAFGAAKAGGTTGDPFGFGARTGHYTDNETGFQLLVHRYYDASAGRFLTRDPIGYRGGINLYLFAENRLPARDDPMGLYDQSSCEDVCGIAAGAACWAPLLAGPEAIPFVEGCNMIINGPAPTPSWVCSIICSPAPSPPPSLGSPTSTCVDTGTGTSTGT